MKNIMTREDAGPSAQEQAKREFLARAIPYMLAKFYRAEAFGVDWRNCKLEQLDDYIRLAEEFARPTEEPMEDWHA